MSDAGFGADWLSLREPFDLAARSPALARAFRAAMPTTRQGAPLRLIDLAAGTGANFRALAPLLAGDQDWRLIDHDPLLLAAQRTRIAGWAGSHGWPCHDEEDDEGPLLRIDAGRARWRLRGQRHDLSHDLDGIGLPGCDGLLTTAFLDLVSAGWLDRLCALLARTPRPLLATLTVDGRRTWQPPLPSDGLVAEAFLVHQGGDKGFGPSLGTTSTQALAARLAARGFQVRTEASDWRIDPTHPAMLHTMAREAAAVASETDPAHAPAARAWLAERSAGIAQGLVSLTIGHQDLLALPP